MGKRSTKTAKESCSPRPQSTVFSLMALRSVEKRYARPSIVSRPSTPVKRPMRGPLSAFCRINLWPGLRTKPSLPALSPDNAANERKAFTRRNFADFVAGRDKTLRLGQLSAAIVMNCDQRLAFFYAVADAFVKFQ